MDIHLISYLREIIGKFGECRLIFCQRGVTLLHFIDVIMFCRLNGHSVTKVESLVIKL